MTARSALTPSCESVCSKIELSGFPAPSSPETTTASKYPARPLVASFSRWRQERRL